MKLTPNDYQILANLQENGRIRHSELAKKLSISPASCMRRVRLLEQAGYIKGYYAKLDGNTLGFEVQVFVMIGLHNQSEKDLYDFEEKCQIWPMVRECHMLNGEIDFILKCHAPNLAMFQSFLTSELTPTPNVAQVRTSMVIRNNKSKSSLPLSLITSFSES